MNPERRRVGAPLAVLAALVFPSVTSGTVARVSASREVEIVASRFRFEPATIEVVRGESVRLVIRSADTDHGLAIRAYRIKKAIPEGGVPVTVDFVASEAGRFPIECSEYCGSGHRRMRGELVVAEPIS